MVPLWPDHQAAFPANPTHGLATVPIAAVLRTPHGNSLSGDAVLDLRQKRSAAIQTADHAQMFVVLGLTDA